MGGTAELLGEAAHHGKAQASAFTGRFGRKEWFEDVGKNVAGNACAIVFDANTDVPARRDEAGAGVGLRMKSPRSGGFSPKRSTRLSSLLSTKWRTISFPSCL